MEISETQFFLDRDADKGLQSQLRERIVMAILRRRFPPGARLPSTRRLAEHLKIARITVSLVYQELTADGYLTSQPRSGIYVSDDPPGVMSAPEARGASEVDWDRRLGTDLDHMALVRKPHDWMNYRYPFVYGQADPGLFPHNEWRDCARRALSKREFNEVALDASTRDDPLLVSYTLSHSLPSRGIDADHGELLITLGAQNAMWLVIAALARMQPRLRVAIEDPCYPELREILRLAGAEVIAIAVDPDGLDPDLLPERLDLVCVTPSHQAPTGATMAEARRRRLLARAEAERFLILEDDYDFEMSFLRPPNPALKPTTRAAACSMSAAIPSRCFPDCGSAI